MRKAKDQEMLQALEKISSLDDNRKENEERRATFRMGIPAVKNVVEILNSSSFHIFVHHLSKEIISSLLLLQKKERNTMSSSTEMDVEKENASSSSSSSIPSSLPWVRNALFISSLSNDWTDCKLLFPQSSFVLNCRWKNIDRKLWKN